MGVLTESRARNRAIELAGIKNGEKILEVAVGTGIAFYEIVQKNPAGMNVGIDISEGMLKKAQKRMKKLGSGNYELKIASAFKIPCPDETFDLIMNNYMFDLIPFAEMDKILSEFKKVLKKNQLSPKLLGGCRGIKMKERLESHGFNLVSCEYVQQMLFPSEIILAVK